MKTSQHQQASEGGSATTTPHLLTCTVPDPPYRSRGAGCFLVVLSGGGAKGSGVRCYRRRGAACSLLPLSARCTCYYLDSPPAGGSCREHVETQRHAISPRAPLAAPSTRQQPRERRGAQSGGTDWGGSSTSLHTGTPTMIHNRQQTRHS